MASLINILGSRIRSFRKQRGLSQEELAEKVDLHYTSIGQLERGEKGISLENLEKIVHALDITFTELFEHIEEKNESSPLNEIVNLLHNQSQKNQNRALQLLQLFFEE